MKICVIMYYDYKLKYSTWLLLNCTINAEPYFGYDGTIYLVSQ